LTPLAAIRGAIGVVCHGVIGAICHCVINGIRNGSISDVVSCYDIRTSGGFRTGGGFRTSVGFLSLLRENRQWCEKATCHVVMVFA